MTPNPWREIPLSDYESHMQSDAVGQAAALSEFFGKVLEQCRPTSVAVLGVAGGNGLERIDPVQTRRVVGVDLNPEYLAITQERFAGMKVLELYTVDLAEDILVLGPFELVHVALLFEHAGLGRCLDNALELTASTGHLSVVLQLPSKESEAVGSSGVASIAKLSSHFKLVDRDVFIDTLAGRGLRLLFEDSLPVPGGKELWLGIFTRN